jgi:hypothetical protein
MLIQTDRRINIGINGFNFYLKHIAIGQLFLKSIGGGKLKSKLGLFAASLDSRNMKSIDSLINKILLVGITVLDDTDKLITQIQVYGPIIRVSADGIVIIRNKTQTEFTIPPDFENVLEARSGEYNLRATGETVVDPDYLSSWTVHCGSSEQAEQYLNIGFVGYEKK